VPLSVSGWRSDRRHRLGRDPRRTHRAPARAAPPV